MEQLTRMLLARICGYLWDRVVAARGNPMWDWNIGKLKESSTQALLQKFADGLACGDCAKNDRNQPRNRTVVMHSFMVTF